MLPLKNCLKVNVTRIFSRGKGYLNHPKLRLPHWFLQKERKIDQDKISEENKIFVDEHTAKSYNVKLAPDVNAEKCESFVRRTGLVGKKIGEYPLWLKNGKKITSTLIQILENDVLKYVAPDEKKERLARQKKYGLLYIGAKNVDSCLLTKEYCGLFQDTGIEPKEKIARFFISPSAKILPGTSLNTNHFQVGQFVDVRGKTISHGFQGVVKRHGFKGMPASHGVTKTHRRPGNIGAGGEKGRVWPGTKMPGHMGNRYRITKGLQILRINTKDNVFWVIGHSVPGSTNGFVYIYDSILPLKRIKEFNIQPELSQCIENDKYFENVHCFRNETINFI